MRVLIIVMLAASVVISGWVLPGRAETDSEDGYTKAVNLLQEGIVFEAIHELERFVRFNPDHEDARMLLAHSLHRIKRDARAAEELAHVVRLNPENMKARRLLTRLRVDIGQRLDRRDRDAVLRYARLCAVPGSYDRASEHYQIALKLKDDPAIHLEFARMLSWAERYEESAYHYERFLAASASNPDVLMELGRVYNASSQFAKAVKVFERCLIQEPDNTPAALDLARALIWSGREDEASVRLQTMVKKELGGEVPLLLLASIARYRHETLEEYALLLRVLELVPGHPEASERIAVLEAGSLLEEARLLARLKSAPDDVALRRQLAELYIEEGRHGDALYHLRLIGNAAPDDESITARLREVRELEMHRVMAQIEGFRELRHADRMDEIVRLENWLENNAGDMKSRLQLAKLYAKDGRYTEAVKHFEWLLAASPGNLFIQQMLSRIQLLLAQHEEADQPDDTPLERRLP